MRISIIQISYILIRQNTHKAAKLGVIENNPSIDVFSRSLYACSEMHKSG